MRLSWIVFAAITYLICRSAASSRPLPSVVVVAPPVTSVWPSGMCDESCYIVMDRITPPHGCDGCPPWRLPGAR